MEENIIAEIAPERKEMRIGDEDKFLLVSSAKWSKFISIVMFVCLGLGMISVILWIIATAVAGFSPYDTGMHGAMAGPMYTMMYAIMWPLMIFALIVYIVQLLPAIYLYRFAEKAKEAVASGSETTMTESLRNLRGSIKTTGIILIATIGFSILLCITTVIVALSIAM